ncbi:MAG TPA: cytochrome c oxidase accessory protein CcoG [Xanthomonadales bacterium]|nr:cytochrome c oxidase accessory protein CcoG [Xanthomonadales bacterium]
MSARKRPIALTVVTDEGAMYARAPKVYPREVDGRLQRLRTAAAWWLLGMFYLFPWVSWGGTQAVLFDLPARKFHVFGLHFWPQDFVYLAWLLIIAAVALFAFTALAGRLWCGYACPQTVWTEVFLWIERRFEGTRNQRIRLDAAPWTRAKLARKAGKQAAWIALALWTGFTFVGFFTPIRELAGRTLAFELGGWEAFWMLFYGFATYGNAGYLREQVCRYMCPYARFQGAMIDRDTLVISYDAARGEARGHRPRGVPSVLERAAPPAGVSVLRPAVGEGLGDCLDCTVCVQVCPTGIDIRDGLQFDCIACGACIDACDDVMDRVGYPRGLIRYTTERALSGGRTRVLRARTAIYGALLLALVAGLAWSLAHRTPLIVDVLRDRNALYREARDGAIENAYTLKLTNKDTVARSYRVALVGAAEGLSIVGADVPLQVPAGTTGAFALTVRAAPAAALGARDIELDVVSDAEPPVSVRHAARFIGRSP